MVQSPVWLLVEFATRPKAASCLFRPTENPHMCPINANHPLAQNRPKKPRKPTGFNAGKGKTSPVAPEPQVAAPSKSTSSKSTSSKPVPPARNPVFAAAPPALPVAPPVLSGYLATPDFLDQHVGEDPGCLPVTEVFDEADQAQWLNLRELAAVQSRARQMSLPETHPDFDGETCVVCGDDMPKERLVLRRIRCVECQSLLEKKTSPHLYARPGAGR